MKKEPSNGNVQTRKSFLLIIGVMAFPLVLEFLIALPLLSLHMIGGGTFWGLGALITISGAAALLLGLTMSLVILSQQKKYFRSGIAGLSYAVLILTIAYIVLIGLMLIDFLKMY